MPHTPFSLDALAKPKAKPKAKAKRSTVKAAPAKRTVAKSSHITPWAKDFFARMDKVREALGDTKLV